MNEVQRINALNEWFIGECSKKSQELVAEVIKENVPVLSVEQRLQQKWLEWAGRN